MTDVLHVISGLGTGGAETMLVQLARGLRARGLSQHVVCLSALSTFSGDLEAAGIDVTMLNAAAPSSWPGACLKALHVVNSLRPRIVQGWMYHGNIAATAMHCLGAGRRDRKLLWNLRASNMDQARYGSIIQWNRRLSRLPDIVVANSEAGAAFHRDCGFRPKSLVVIDNGVDTRKFCPDSALRKQVRAEFGIAEDAVVVINVARVDPMKDHDTFLAAMRQTSSAVGILVGSGTQDLPLPANVRAVGPSKEVERLLAAADAVASTSAFGEGFSNAIAEGMSAGLIPVATDVGDARRIVGDAGLIVPPRDPCAFAEAVTTIASRPRDERARNGALARERILSQFTLESTIDHYFDLYRTSHQPAS